MRVWQEKLNKSMTLPVLSGSRKQNQYPDVPGTQNELTEMKHPLKLTWFNKH